LLVRRRGGAPTSAIHACAFAVMLAFSQGLGRVCIEKITKLAA
jgi:hypothetical protein